MLKTSPTQWASCSLMPLWWAICPGSRGCGEVSGVRGEAPRRAQRAARLGHAARPAQVRGSASRSSGSRSHRSASGAARPVVGADPRRRACRPGRLVPSRWPFPSRSARETTARWAAGRRVASRRGPPAGYSGTPLPTKLGHQARRIACCSTRRPRGFEDDTARAAARGRGPCSRRAGRHAVRRGRGVPPRHARTPHPEPRARHRADPEERRAVDRVAEEGERRRHRHHRGRRTPRGARGRRRRRQGLRHRRDVERPQARLPDQATADPARRPAPPRQRRRGRARAQA